MRDKEKVHDYRFMPEPNLPPLVIYTNETLPRQTGVHEKVVNIDEVRQQLPEIPDQTRQRLQHQYNFSLGQTLILVVSGWSSN